MFPHRLWFFLEDDLLSLITGEIPSTRDSEIVVLGSLVIGFGNSEIGFIGSEPSVRRIGTLQLPTFEFPPLVRFRFR